MSRWFFAIMALALMSVSASAQAEKKKVERLTPTAADVAYGEHPDYVENTEYIETPRTRR